MVVGGGSRRPSRMPNPSSNGVTLLVLLPGNCPGGDQHDGCKARSHEDPCYRVHHALSVIARLVRVPLGIPRAHQQDRDQHPSTRQHTRQELHHPLLHPPSSLVHSGCSECARGMERVQLGVRAWLVATPSSAVSQPAARIPTQRRHPGSRAKPLGWRRRARVVAAGSLSDDAHTFGQLLVRR